jgi:hypothetical protein
METRRDLAVGRALNALDGLPMLTRIIFPRFLENLELQREVEAKLAGRSSSPSLNRLRHLAPALGPIKAERGFSMDAVWGGIPVSLVMLFERQRLFLTVLDAVVELLGHRQERVLIAVKTCLTLSRELGASGDYCRWARARKPCSLRE